MIGIEGVTGWSLALIIRLAISSLEHTQQHIITLFLGPMIGKGQDDGVGLFWCIAHMFKYMQWVIKSNQKIVIDYSKYHDSRSMDKQKDEKDG